MARQHALSTRPNHYGRLGLLLLTLNGSPLAAATTDFSQPEPGEILSGGDATVFKSNRNAFSLPSANLSITRKLDFSVGNSFFRNPWVSSPATTTARDGLGPLFNTNGCQNCHIKDGRGRPPEPGERAVSLFLRLSIPPRDAHERALLTTQGVIPEPTYGGQLQNFAVQGLPAEGQMQIDYTPVEMRFADGETITLRKPHYSISQLGYGPLHPQTLMSPRIAPPMIGLGLLEAIPETALLAHADPEDRDGDGISGRPNRVWDVTAQRTVMGRFGWKAGQPTVRQQSAGAFNGDMGLTTTLFPHTDCSERQPQCQQAPHGGQPEVPDRILDFVTFYARNLAVPARRASDDPQVLQGKRLFHAARCATCHVPSFRTATLPEHPEQSEQLIWPYTDLLLHDMGDGLADGRPEFAANGREWRTPPLWGIGLTETVNGHTYFLHDGRARNLMEAILWHDGEAHASRDAVLQFNKTERQALIRFLESL